MIRAAIALTALTTILLGVAYPLVVWGVGRVAFPSQAEGSLVVQGGKVVGSSLIGQRFSSEKYFHGRPSAAGTNGYDGMASSGSNLGPTSRVLADRISSDTRALALPPSTKPPVDLVTASASGLDPHVSPEAARLQIDRVARARGIARDTVARLVEEHVEGRTFGLLGEPRVNVLALNLALDALRP